MKLSDAVGSKVRVGLFGPVVQVVRIKTSVSERTKKKNPNVDRNGVLAIVRTIKTNKIESMYGADSTVVYPAENNIFSNILSSCQNWFNGLLSDLLPVNERVSLFKEGCLEQKETSCCWSQNQQTEQSTQEQEQVFELKG